VLLALFADWLNYARNPLSPEKLLHEIAQRTGQALPPVTEAHKQLFEKVLIERIASFQTPEERAVMYLAIAYQRMTPDMLRFLTDLPCKPAAISYCAIYVRSRSSNTKKGILCCCTTKCGDWSYNIGGKNRITPATTGG
jgi:hypothetical protein